MELLTISKCFYLFLQAISLNISCRASKTSFSNSSYITPGRSHFCWGCQVDTNVLNLD